MKKTNQMRINNDELKAIYVAVRNNVASFVDHYKEDGTPVYTYSEENEIMLGVFYKLFKEMNERGLYNA